MDAEQLSNDLSGNFSVVRLWISGLFDILPLWGRFILGFVLVFILFEIILAYVNELIKHPRIEELIVNRKKVYFFGPGYKHVATILGVTTGVLEDRTGFGVSGLAHSFGNITDDSRTKLFFLSLIYVPLSLVGFVELVLRVFIGYIILFVFTTLHSSIVFVGMLIGLLLVAILRVVELATQK